MKNEILKLNTGNEGSFGEFLFEYVAKKYCSNVKRVHHDYTDFKVDGVKIDVKTTYQHIDKKWQIDKFHHGTKVAFGIERINVVMYDNCVSINYDNSLITF